ncbi:hypothetical protein [Mastigocoleus testarum]|uniref:Uncharacterized protein n=1 Tax=Mastigocoleus testarum BC008 TaxID=371196 RepID=A0A0V7ZJ19_9CYAN|nr:hypothetical protein [Mastigocoleus testarum]KST64433.1 hypothetical protein BC008_17530 [Mastigocoleus testarum BC008]
MENLTSEYINLAIAESVQEKPDLARMLAVISGQNGFAEPKVIEDKLEKDLTGYYKLGVDLNAGAMENPALSALKSQHEANKVLNQESIERLENAKRWSEKNRFISIIAIASGIAASILTITSMHRTSLAEQVIQGADARNAKLVELTDENERLTKLAKDYQEKNEELMGSKLAKRLKNWRILYYQANKEKEKISIKLNQVCSRKRNRFAAPECYGYR